MSSHKCNNSCQDKYTHLNSSERRSFDYILGKSKTRHIMEPFPFTMEPFMPIMELYQDVMEAS